MQRLGRQKPQKRILGLHGSALRPFCGSILAHFLLLNPSIKAQSTSRIKRRFPAQQWKFSLRMRIAIGQQTAHPLRACKTHPIPRRPPVLDIVLLHEPSYTVVFQALQSGPYLLFCLILRLEPFSVCCWLFFIAIIKQTDLCSLHTMTYTMYYRGSTDVTVLWLHAHLNCYVLFNFCDAQAA